MFGMADMFDMANVDIDLIAIFISLIVLPEWFST